MDYFNEQWKSYQHTLMAEAIQRVRELHKSVMVVNKEFCIICENHQQDMSPFPCETIQALDGEQ